MKRWLAFFVPFLLVCALGLGALGVRSLLSTPCAEYADVDFFDLEPGMCVRVAGTAHYDVVVTQHVAGNGFFDDKSYFVYGLFPRGNTSEREIRVLVRTERPPEARVSFEDMVISGRLVRMDNRKIPFDTETRMGRISNYFFSDRVAILEPDRIEVDGEPAWTAPK